MARKSAISVLTGIRPSHDKARLRLLTAVFFSFFAAAVHAGPAGEILVARGIVTAQDASGGARIAANGTALSEGDTVTTAARSAAVLKLADGSRITLRPNSSFQIEAFNTEPNQERAVFRLFKGGLRAVSGFLSKRNKNAVRLQTSVATIGIRGTELDIRLCEDDCAEEARRRPAPAGRVGFVRGKVIAKATNGERAREIKAGDPIYNGDVLLTSANSNAVLGFRDDSRVTLLPNTEFRVDKLIYDEEQPERNRGFFALVRGGLRAVTGAIGKSKRRNYRMRTSVATIGIRGTGYDLLCQGLCQSPAATPDPSGDGLFADVWDGGIDIDNANPVNAGSTVFISAAGQTPVSVPGLPTPMTLPRPDSVSVPAPPPPSSSSNPNAGLYVSCYSGSCAVETPGNTVELAANEAGFVGSSGAAQQLPEVPPFQAEDPVLHSIEVGSALSLDADIDVGGIQCSAN